MNYRDFTLDDWIEHINKVINDEDTLDGNEMRYLVEFLATIQKPKTDIFDKIRVEIENTMETIIGRYDSTTPIYDKPSYKIERNKARKECIKTIDKYKQDI